MRSIRKVLLRSLAIVAFTGLTIGSTSALSRAGGGLDTGAGGLGYQGAEESIENSTGAGAGAGGSTDTVTTPDTAPRYRGSDVDSNPSYKGSDVDSNTGSGTGGSTDTDTSLGSGTNGSTDSDNDVDKDTLGTTRGGVTYPDYSGTLGVGGGSYYHK